MPKQKIQVMVDPDLFQAISEFSKVSNQSMSSVVADYLAMAKPTFERMTASLRGFTELTGKQKQAFVEGLVGAEALAKERVQDVLVTLMEAMSLPNDKQLSLDVQGVSTARQREAEPPFTNRGDSSPSTKPSKPAPRKASKPISSKKKIEKIAR